MEDKKRFLKNSKKRLKTNTLTLIIITKAHGFLLYVFYIVYLLYVFYIVFNSQRILRFTEAVIRKQT